MGGEGSTMGYFHHGAPDTAKWKAAGMSSRLPSASMRHHLSHPWPLTHGDPQNLTYWGPFLLLRQTSFSVRFPSLNENAQEQYFSNFFHYLYDKEIFCIFFLELS